jgi:hypothetical protein
MTVVPSAARVSMRRIISSVGTGFEKSSNSLQYLQARLQRRVTTTWASMGWLGDLKALATKRISR